MNCLLDEELSVFASAVQARAEENEAANGLFLGLLGNALSGEHPGLRSARVIQGERLAGCALQTPPHNLVLGPIELEAVDPFVRACVHGNWDLPGVVGAAAAS